MKSAIGSGLRKTAEPPASGGLALRYAAWMQGLRDAIDVFADTSRELRATFMRWGTRISWSIRSSRKRLPSI